jgi:metallo-beta-lactamase family protein
VPGQEINAFRAAIIIAASGMAESGRILPLIRSKIPDNIIACRFMAENTLGRRLAERAPEIKIFGKTYQVKAEIATLNAFSAHADYAETCAWLKRHDLRRLKKVFLVHGEPEAQSRLQQELLGIGIPAVEIVRYGGTYELN